MTTRETSLKAYQQLIDSGQLKGNQAKIAQAVIKLPDHTSGEICAALEIENVNAWRARFTELQERGLIQESGQRKCKVTGRTCVTWRYTDRTKPLKIKKRLTSTQLRDIAIDAIDLLYSHDAPNAKTLRDRLQGAA